MLLRARKNIRRLRELMQSDCCCGGGPWTGSGSWVGAVEILIHELAHWRTIPPNPKRTIPDEFDVKVGSFFSELSACGLHDRADELEAEAVTVEVLVFQMLGLDLNSRYRATSLIIYAANGLHMSARMKYKRGEAGSPRQWLLDFVADHITDERLHVAAERVVEDLLERA